MKFSKKTQIPKEKTHTLLIIGAILLIAAGIFSLYAYHTSYQESFAYADSLKPISAAIQELKDLPELTNDQKNELAHLQVSQAQLKEEKLAAEKPYSYGLTALFLATMMTIKGIYNALIGVTPAKKADVKKLAQAGLLAALCYIGFAFFKIDIPVGTEKTAFHFGNVFCVLAALLLGGTWGGLAGAVGMTIGDLTTSYVTSAPKTFLLKLLIGLIVGFIAHRVFRITKAHSKRYVTGVTIFACICGMGFNVVADPVVGYFYKTYLLGVPQDLSAALAKIAAVTTSINAVIAVICATIFYLALCPALKKANLFVAPAQDSVPAITTADAAEAIEDSEATEVTASFDAAEAIKDGEATEADRAIETNRAIEAGEATEADRAIEADEEVK